MPSPHLATRNIARPVVLGALSVVVTAAIVQVTRSGVDILALMVGGFVLLLIERTLGDWVAESVGPATAAVLFAGVAALALVYMQTDSGRGRASRFFAAAEAHGYHTTYFKVGDNESGQAQVASAAAASDRVTRQQPAQSLAPASPVAVPARPSATLTAASTEPTARGVRITRLRLEPEVGVVGRPVTFRVELGSEEEGTYPPVEFSVDGRIIATAPARDGVAKTSWSTSVPGQYVVRARVAGSFLASGSSRTLNVLPGR